MQNGHTNVVPTKFIGKIFTINLARKGVLILLSLQRLLFQLLDSDHFEILKLLHFYSRNLEESDVSLWKASRLVKQSRVQETECGKNN